MTDFFSTLDLVTVGRTVRNCGRWAVKELLTHRKDADLNAGYGLAAAAAVAATLLFRGRSRSVPGRSE